MRAVGDVVNISPKKDCAIEAFDEGDVDVDDEPEYADGAVARIDELREEVLFPAV